MNLSTTLNKVQSEYSIFRITQAQNLNKNELDEVNRSVFKPLERRLSRYEQTLGRGRSIALDLSTSGELLRRQIDLIRNRVNEELAKNAPEPASILAVVGQFGSFGDKIGNNIFTTIKDEAAPAAAADAKADDDVDVKDDPTKPTSAMTPASAILSMKAADDIAKAGVELKSKGIADAADASKPANKSAAGANAKVVAKPAQTKSPSAVETYFKKLLSEFKWASNLSFAVEGQGGKIIGTYVDPAAEAGATKAAKDAARAKAKAVKHAWEQADNVRKALRDTALQAERVHTRIMGWQKPAQAINEACPGDSKSDKVKKDADAIPQFTVSPEIHDVTLTVGKPLSLTVANNGQIPKVSVSGNNIDKVKYETKVSDGNFIISITAAAAIESDKPAIMTITDFTGKRDFKIEVDAKT